MEANKPVAHCSQTNSLGEAHDTHLRDYVSDRGKDLIIDIDK